MEVSCETFEMETKKGKKGGTCTPQMKGLVVVFLITIVIVGLLCGILAGKKAKADAETVCAREKLEGIEKKIWTIYI